MHTLVGITLVLYLLKLSSGKGYTAIPLEINPRSVTGERRLVLRLFLEIVCWQKIYYLRAK